MVIIQLTPSPGQPLNTGNHGKKVGREIPHGTPPKTGLFNLNGDGMMSSQILSFEVVIIYPAW